MAEQSLAELPKTTLLQRLHGQIAANKRAKNAAEHIGEKVQGAVGSATAAATGALIGYAEVKYGDPVKGPMALGPVELPLAIAASATALAFFGFNPFGQMTFVAAGAAGAYGAGRGRAMAVAQIAAEEEKKKAEEESKKTEVKPKIGYSGEDDYEDADSAFLDA